MSIVPSFSEMLFWIAIALLVYTHIGYPVLLWLWAILRTRPQRCNAVEPSLTVVVIAFNEADRIQQRLDNLLAVDYPREHLNIVLASDGSNDDTAARAQAYIPAGVRIFEFAKRRGKSAVLSEVLPKLETEIIVLADVRQQFDKGALRALVSHFTDSNVGAVSGELMLCSSTGAAGPITGEGIGTYWKYEKFIRKCESKIDSVIGVSGAIYALRKSLFTAIPEDTILDDVLIPMLITRQGYRVVFEPRARAYDLIATAEIEFRRKVRTLAGNFQLFANHRWLLNPLKNRLWIQTVSHKLCRLTVPPCLLITLLVSFQHDHWPIYHGIFVLQCAFYLAALLRCLLIPHIKKRLLLEIPFTFCALNWAVVVGLLGLISGRQRVTWDRTNQNVPKRIE